jgi:dephospho-CoA kinase
VTYAPQDIQVARLVQKRGMSEAAALQRINAQTPQEKKIEAAKVVIRNDGTFEGAWIQVVNAWNQLFPSVETEPKEEITAKAGEVVIQRARPREAADIAELITRLSGGRRKPSREDIMAAFGEKAFLMLRVDGKARGVAGWKVENLVARTDDVFVDEQLPLGEALSAMMKEVERVSRELQCEVSLIFLPVELSSQDPAFQAVGYQRRTVQSLGVRAWEEAALESMPAGSIMLFKQLRQDRVLRPV